MTPEETVHHLLSGEIEVVGRINASSNQALLVQVHYEGRSIEACFKTELGERPLWDFPGGLWRREVAAFELSRIMNLDLVPETVGRAESEFGPGSLQRWITATDDHYFTLREDSQLASWFIDLACWDFIANNTDRKSGHVLFDETRCWAIDQGLCFAEEDKLRTVIWDFAGTPIPASVSDGIAKLLETQGGALNDWLSLDEVTAALERATWLETQGELPFPNEENEWPPYPWPLI